jgi:hypothetical protein
VFIALEGGHGMFKLATVFVACALGCAAHAQSRAGKTIEGYWQDTARRILYSGDAPPGYKYGEWTALDQNQTYPSAKQIQRSGNGYELVDLLYDDQEAVRVLKGSDNGIEFTRTNRWSGCSVLHQCGLEQDQLLCKLRTSCGDWLVWQGEERYERRASCERTQSRPEAQGIPTVCR